MVAESEFIRRHVSDQKRQLVTEMLFIIRSKFVKLVNESAWMPRPQRQKALSKLKKLQFLVGGPREVFDKFGFAEDLGLYGVRVALIVIK